MSTSHLSNEEFARRGEEIYERALRSTVETEENVGKILAIDVETGEFAIDQTVLPAVDVIRAKHPGAVVYTMRIGYDAVYGFGDGPGRVEK